MTAAKGGSPMARNWSVAILAILSIIWGMAFVAIKYSVTFLSPVNLTLLRWFLASCALLALAPFLGRWKGNFQLKDLPRLALVSFANVVSYHLTLNFSESSISAGLAVLITSMGPVFILLLSWLFLAERHGKNVLIAVSVAFAGMVILSVGSDMSADGSSLYGILEAMGTALSYSVFAVFSKPLVMKYGAVPVTIWAGLLGTLMLIPLNSPCDQSFTFWQSSSSPFQAGISCGPNQVHTPQGSHPSLLPCGKELQVAHGWPHRH